MSLTVRPQFVRDVADIADRLAETSHRAALHFRERVGETVELISLFPEIGEQAHAQELAATGVRLFTIKRFRDFVIIYRTGTGGTEVLRVVDGRRDLPEFFEPY